MLLDHCYSQLSSKKLLPEAGWKIQRNTAEKYAESYWPWNTQPQTGCLHQILPSVLRKPCRRGVRKSVIREDGGQQGSKALQIHVTKAHMNLEIETACTGPIETCTMSSIVASCLVLLLDSWPCKQTDLWFLYLILALFLILCAIPMCYFFIYYCILFFKKIL